MQFISGMDLGQTMPINLRQNEKTIDSNWLSLVDMFLIYPHSIRWINKFVKTMQL